MIGIFDSGIGGLSVLSDAIKNLPNENFVYFGDFENAPYGIKTKKEVIEFSKNICDFLIKEHDVKAIVIACNTATSAAIKILREKYSIPIIGMEPAIKPAIETRDSEKIGVLATEMTLKEDKFNTLVKSLKKNKKIIKIPCSPLVNLIENMDFDSKKLEEIFHTCIEPVRPLDGLVLGCTHFLFIKDYLENKYNHEFEIYDGNLGTIRHLKWRLEKLNLKTKYSSDGSYIITGSGHKRKINQAKEIFKYYHEERIPWTTLSE